MKLVARNKARRESGQSNGSNAKKTNKSKSGGGIQVGLHAFFKRPSDTPAGSTAKRQRTPPTSPDNDQSDVEVITIDD